MRERGRVSEKKMSKKKDVDSYYFFKPVIQIIRSEAP
jgi:hypothetical protein